MACLKIKHIAILCFVCSLVGVITAQTERNVNPQDDLLLTIFFEEVCIDRQVCNDKGHVIEDGSGLIKFRRRLNKPVNGTCTFGEVVCKAPIWDTSPPGSRGPLPTPTTSTTTAAPTTSSTAAPAVTTPTPVTTTGSSTQTGGGSTKLPQPNVVISDTTDYSVCGHRNPRGLLDRVRNTDRNSESELGEFPWMVSIMCISSNSDCGREPNETDQYLCGGSLIAPNVVVTTARYTRFKDAAQLLVRAGDWDRSTVQERLQHQDSNVKELVLHDDYNKASGLNSISLLILETPFQWSAHIRPICLPLTNFQFDRANCFVSGWGKDSTDKNSKIANILTKVDLAVVPNDDCQSMLRKTILGDYFKLNAGFLCAGGIDGKDACLGDGGSPLSCPLENTEEPYYLAGLVNWGLDCGVKNVPGVYTNVPKLRSWIDEKLAERSIKITSTSN